MIFEESKTHNVCHVLYISFQVTNYLKMMIYVEFNIYLCISRLIYFL